uniref:ELYS-bb domain-containing protein n=1 Tax=Wuchereria bancrofti TaxID=6293 RepID=A0A1I8ERA1_WUCBA
MFRKFSGSGKKAMLKQQGILKKVKLISEKRRSEIWGKFLTQQGEYTDWYYIIRKNCILIRQIYYKSPILYSCGFRGSCTITDVCSLPFGDGSLGVVVAVNDEQNEEYFLAYYSVKMNRIVKKILIRTKITKVVTVLDATRKNEIECLHENLRSFPHLVAVGTSGGDCLLVHFGIDLPNITDPELRKPPFSSNLCKPYISDGRFNFMANNGTVYPVSVDEIHVTAITYLERCKTVVIGFSCGAFITVNLLNGSDASYYYSSSPVYGFSCQEPMDDPRPVLYLWVAYSKGKQKNPHVILLVINFPNDEGQPPNEWTFNDLMIINYLTWSPEKCTEWVSFRTVVSSSSREHAAKNSISERLLNIEESFLRVHVTDTSRLLMTWRTTTNTIEGALFDLNAFYYKRLPRQVTFAESFLKLNPFFSLFTLPISNDQHACLDYLVNYSGVWQHRSPYSETNDFFIFAPSYTFEIIAFNGSCEFTIFVPSIQKVVLKWLDQNFEDAIGQKSDLACAYLNAVGLAKTPTDISESSQISTAPLENESIIISSLLFNGEINDTLKKHIISCPSYDTIHQIASLIWKEVLNHGLIVFRVRYQLQTCVGCGTVQQFFIVLRNCLLKFRKEYHQLKSDVFAEKIADATTSNYSMMASRNLVFYTNIVFLFHHGELLPIKNYTALNARMKTKVDERKERLAPGSKLYIIKLLEEMQSACPDEIFWCDLTADEWYPPNSIGALLSATLAIKITETSKHKLIGYFLLDYDDLMGKEPKVFDRFKWLFPYRNQAICNQIERNWRNDCGLEEPLSKCGKSGITNTKAEEPVCEVQQLMKRLLLNRKEIELIKVDRCDRWTAKILEDFPVIQTNDIFPHKSGGEMMRDTSSKQRATVHPYLLPVMRSHSECETTQIPRDMHDVVPKSLGLETTFKASNFPTSPVCDRRVSNYERILPKEDLENVHRLLQTPTPRRRRTAGIHVKDSFTSPTADQFSPVSLPASILKTRRERRHENTSTDVTESQFKSLRFDLPNSFVSNCDSIISNTSQLKERECKDDPLETNYADALDAPNPDGLEFTDMNKEVFLEKHLELEDELKTLVKKDERTEYTSTTSQESPHKISVEEQSDSDIVEEQEVNGLHDKTEPSLMINENSLIQKSTAPVSVSYEEQEDPGIPLDEDAHNINSDVCVEDKQSIYSAGSLPESTSVLTTKISRHSATFGIKISSEPPKKRSDSLIDEIAAEWEGNIASTDNIGSTVSESLQKKISYEQEDESDPTSTEIEKAVVCDPETKLASTWRKLEGQEDVEVEFSGSVNLPPRRSRPKQEDAVGQAVRTFSSDSFHSSDSDSEISTLSHRMLTRSAAKDNSLILTAKLVSLSPEVQTTLRKRLESGSSLTHSRETTPRRLTRAISSAKSSSRTEKTRRKRPKSRTSSPCNLETTPKRLTRTTYSSKSPSKTEEIRRKRSESRTSSSCSRETTPKRLIRTISSSRSSPKIEGIRRKRSESRTSLTHSREVTPQRSTRPVSAKNSPTRKSLRSRTQSEQIEAKETIPTVTPKASPNRRRRAASEESQLNKTSTPSHPMLTRSARKAKSENGSPPKQRTMSGFEPSLAKIDEVPKKGCLRVGRK